MRLLFVLSYFVRCSASCYFDVKQEEFDFELLKLTNDSSFTTQLSNEYDDSQREINIFDLNSSPILNDNNFNFNFKNSLSNLNDNDTKTNYKRQNSDFLLSPDKDIFNTMRNFTKKMDGLINNNNNNHEDNNCKNISSENHSKSKPLDMVDGVSNSDASLLTLFNKNKNSSANDSYVRSSSSNDSKNSSKQRHISSNSFGENCNAQELPLIEYGK
jgi:hypothetical protein